MEIAHMRSDLNTSETAFWPTIGSARQHSISEEIVLYPLILCSKKSNATGIFGELDGLRHIRCSTMAAEDVINQPEGQYMVFSGAWKTDSRSFVALLKA